jgi:2-polyprenyl-3-methyl-5-hydroxy-6-metoxy-1,4-benzoquinol methylase
MIKCKICKEQTNQSEIKVRSGKVLKVNHCQKCDFDFFDFDPTQLLSEDKLDDSRLKSAGLDIPSIEKDFENGLKQSLPYVTKFISDEDKGTNILEIGCSVGYFLSLLKEKNINAYGVELNVSRTKFVNDHLNIPCFENLEKCESQNLKFDKIFLFYVLEYITDPIDYFKRLINMLNVGGSIILVSPNLDDFLKDGWQNEGFRSFFYDECAINYFTFNSMKKFANSLPIKSYELYTQQGYSFVNHISWYLTQKPRTTGIVGGDKFVEAILQNFENSNISFKEESIKIFKDFDLQYRKLLEKYNYGNQLYLIINKV